jgi:hypothetical protein
VRAIHNDDPPRPVDALDRLLTDANPLRPEDAVGLVSPRAFDELFDQITAHEVDPVVAGPVTPIAEGTRSAPRRRWRLGHKAAAGTVAVAVLFGGAAAAAATFPSLHTAVFGHSGDTEDTPGQEFLNLSAQNAPQVAENLGKDFPYPPGTSAATYVPGLIQRGGLMQATGIKATLADDAECAWWGYWLQAQREDDTAAQAQATATIGQIPTWPVVMQTDGGGVVAQDQQLAAAAEQGDPAPIQQSYTANSCASLPTPWAHQ